MNPHHQSRTHQSRGRRPGNSRPGNSRPENSSQGSNRSRTNRSRRPRPSRAVLRAHTPADLMAFVPLALGFVPAESVVIIAIGQRGPHARADLPAEHEADALGREIAHTYVRHGVRRVAVIGCSATPERLDPVLLQIADRLDAAHVRVEAVLAAGHGYGRALSDDLDDPGEPFTFDAEAHPFRAQAVLDGHVVRGSREEVVALVAHDQRLADEVARRRAEAVPDQPFNIRVRQMWRALDLDCWSGPDAVRWTAEALSLLADPEGSLELWLVHDAVEADGQVGHWCRVLQACPEEELVPVAAVAAQVAWASGNGALAWSVLDRLDHLTDRATAWATDSTDWAVLGAVRRLLVGAHNPRTALTEGSTQIGREYL